MRLPRLSTLLRPLALMLVAVTLAACATEGPPKRGTPELRFTNLAPLMVAAQGPRIQTVYVSPLRNPNVEHLMPVSPERAIRQWVQDRLHATGAGVDTLVVEIRDASVVETRLSTKKGVVGFFTDDQEAKYDAKANVVLQMRGPDGRVKAEAFTSAWRTRSINEKASLADREQIWFDLVEELMRDVDQQLETGLRQYFSDYLLR